MALCGPPIKKQKLGSIGDYSKQTQNAFGKIEGSTGKSGKNAKVDLEELRRVLSSSSKKRLLETHTNLTKEIKNASNAMSTDPTNTPEVIVLEPGLVLMRNFFSDERCKELFEQTMRWSETTDEDGFYTTSEDGKRVFNTGEKGRGRIYDNINRFDPSLGQDCKRIVDTAMESDSKMPAMNCTHVLINMYTNSDGLVWHRDIYENDGQKDHPIVLQSVGASCKFGLQHEDDGPVRELIIRSGDALLFGGPCRLIKHAVLDVMLDECPAWMADNPVRVSFTYRDSPNVLGREHEFKYFKIDEHLVGQESFDTKDQSARVRAMKTQKGRKTERRNSV